MIRIYGVEKGEASWSRVTQGMRLGLREAGKLSGFYDVSRVNDELEGSGLEAGAYAPIGVCVGPPSTAGALVGRGLHQQRLLMIAANSSWLPLTMLDRASRIVTGFLAPSEWAAQVIRDQLEELPVYVWKHGVDPGFRPTGQWPGEQLKVLHLASTHMQRKGTSALIWGWCDMIRDQGLDPGDLQLYLIVDGPRGYYLHEIFEATRGDTKLADSISLQTRRGLTIDAARDLYCQHHIVCQPSRGEGFGMVPLEARACGVPVVATACTGHQEHMEGCDKQDGVVIVPHSWLAPIDDGPGAVAPAVTATAVAGALWKAVSDLRELWDAAQSRAAEVRGRWSWEQVTRDFLSTAARELV